MALTKEQIKNLKSGDPLILHGEFHHVDYAGDIWMSIDGHPLWFSPSSISLPPKSQKEAFEHLKESEELATPKQYEFRRIKKYSFNPVGSSHFCDKDEYVTCSIYCDGKHICDVEWQSYGFNQGHVNKWPHFVNSNNRARFIAILRDFLRTSEVYYDVF